MSRIAKRIKKSGAANLRESGRVALLIGMTPEERELIRVAAAKSGKASSVWMLEVALKSANRREK